MANKKKAQKPQKLGLSDFLADNSTGRSWADEMDELPTAPAPRDPNEPMGGGLGGSHLSRFDGNNRYGDRDNDRRGGDRDADRPPRAEVPIPDKAPFNTFVGNLSWEVSSTDLEQFFGATHITSIRMINDSATGKPKGYGYVEFSNREALVDALDKSGRELGGRVIRISVAEAPREREDRTGGAWRREGPLPTLDDNRRTRNNSSNNYDRSSTDDVDRGERMGFGSKFVPASTSGSGLGQRSQSGRGYSRAGGEGGPGAEEEGDLVDRGVRMGFGSKFVPSVAEPRKDRDPPTRGSNFVPARGTPAGSEDGHSVTGGSSRRPTLGDRKPGEVALTPADTVSTWRSTKSSNLSVDRESAPSSSTLPPTRRKLALAARTVSPSDGTSTPPQSQVTSAKPSPFGAAKPIDSTERDRAIQEKLEKEREELAALVSRKAVGISHKPSQEALNRRTEELASAAPVEAAPPPSVPRAPKPNPFGEAKPVDTLQKELQIEEKLGKEKKLLEEKIKKEAADAKEIKLPSKPDAAVDNPSLTDTSKKSDVPPAISPSSAAPAPLLSNKPTTSQTKWRSPAAESSKLANGKPPAPAPLNSSTEKATSPKSPNLSSFRKEGISFAALAKAAATQPLTNGSAAPAKGVPEESRSKQSPQAPRTILKRAEGVSLQSQ